MPKVVKWTIYYDNDEPFYSDDGSPSEAPTDGILLIIQHRDNGVREVLQKGDYYLFCDGEWKCGQLNDLERWLRKELPELKYGRMTDLETWNKAKTEALSDG